MTAAGIKPGHRPPDLRFRLAMLPRVTGRRPSGRKARASEPRRAGLKASQAGGKSLERALKKFNVKPLRMGLPKRVPAT